MKRITIKDLSPDLSTLITQQQKQLSFRAKETIFSAGEKVEGLYFVRSGKVKITKTNSNNQEVIIRLAGHGMILGHRGFGGDWKYPVTATALVESSIDFLPIDSFNMIAKTNAEFSYFILMFFAEELRKTEDSVAHLLIKNRIARFIYRNYEAFGFKSEKSNKISYPLSRKDFTLQAGTTYESTVRALSSLSNDKIIRLDGKDIYILDLKKLKKEAALKP